MQGKIIEIYQAKAQLKDPGEVDKLKVRLEHLESFEDQSVKGVGMLVVGMFLSFIAGAMLEKRKKYESDAI